MSISCKTPLAALIGALLSLPLSAAEPAADPANTTELPKIKVTALSSSVLLNTPGTVSVIGRQEMDRHLVTTIRDLVQYEPGVSVVGGAGRFGLDSFNIRGLSGNRTRIEIDGVSMPASFGASVGGGSFRAGRNFIDLDTVKQVDIVRGPASAIYPSDSLGGMVSLVTKDPADYLKPGKDVYRSLKEQYDSADRSLSSTLTLAGGDATNGILIVANHREGSDTTNQGKIGGIGSTRTRPDPLSYVLDSILGKYVHAATSGRVDRVIVDASQQRVRSNSLSSLSSTVGYYNSQDANTRARLSIGQWFPHLDGVLADTLDWNAYWQKTRSRTDTQTEASTTVGEVSRYYDNLPLQEKVLGGKLVAVKHLGEGSAVAQTISYGLELSRTQAESNVDGYGVNQSTGVVSSDKPYLPGNYPLHLIPSSQTKRYALFGQDEISLWDGRLTLQPGLRADSYHYQPDNDVLYAKYNTGYQAKNFSASRVSPKLGAIWRFNEHLSAYANYAQGFRPPLYSEIAGAWNEQPIAGFNIAYLPNDHLKSETSKGLELGLRGQGDAGWFNLAAYYNRYRNFIWSGYALAAADVPAWAYQISPGARQNFFYQAVNADRAVIKGLEASGTLRLGAFSDVLAGWSLKGSAALTSGKLIEPGDTGYSPLNTVDPAKLVIGVAYDAQSWGAELVGTAVRRHTRLSDTTAFRPGGYGTLDLYAHYNPSDNVELFAGVSNLTNRHYWDWGQLNGGALGNFLTGNGLNDSGTGGIPADRLSMPGRSASLGARISF